MLAAIPVSPPTGAGTSVVQALLPALGGLGMVMFLVANGNPIFLLAGMVMLVATIGGAVALFVFSRTGQRKAFRESRSRYLEYLEQQRDVLDQAAAAQHRYGERAHPDPRVIAGLAGTERMYERRPADPDFGELRVGLGLAPNPLRVVIPAPPSPLEEPDPVCRRAATALATAHRMVSNQPITVPVLTHESVVIRSADGDEPLLEVVRSILVQIAIAHSPLEVRLAIASPRLDTDFAAAMWLPHALDPHEREGAVPRRWLAADHDELDDDIRGHLRARIDEAARGRRVGASWSPSTRLVVLVDERDSGPTPGVRLPDASFTLHELGVSVVRLVASEPAEPAAVDLRVEVAGGEVTVTVTAAGLEIVGTPDPVTADDLDVVARAIAPMVAEPDAVIDEPLVSDTDIGQILGFDLSRWTARDGWRERELRDFLRVPIGVRDDGRPLMLDIKESARGGMGPHGLLVGATGSGKSELLRSIVLALAASHTPEHLALVLVDFKGGATFAGLEGLPHVAGVITNLESDLAMVDRVHDALRGELARRMQLLHDAGLQANIYDYARARSRRPDLAPLPHLLVIVDEFAELLTVKPDL
ncbi:MAG: FtsK/SpoIIIE domain-containing protein, partial [Phycicoccus sp.]